MNQYVKQRIIGSVVIIVLLALFLPILLHKPTPASVSNTDAEPVSEIAIQLPLSDTPTASAALPAPVAAVSAHAPAVVNSPASVTATPMPVPVAAVHPSASTVASAPAAVNPPASVTATPMPVPAAAVHPSASTTASAPARVPAAMSVSAPTVVTTPSVAVKPSVPVKVSVAETKKPVLSDSQTPALRALQMMQAPQAWVVQVASFSSAKQAEHLMKRLRAYGFSVYARTAVLRSGQKIVRVFIGPKIRRGDIEKIQRALQQHFHLHGMIRKYEL